MKDYELIISMINRAQKEIVLHKKEKAEHEYWYSGHKGKAERAIKTARELLLEASKDIID